MPQILVAELDPALYENRFKIIDELDALTGWAISGAGATQSLDTVNFKQGLSGYKQTVPASIAASSQKTFPPVDMSGVGSSDQIRFWMYVDNAARVSASQISFIDNQGTPVTASYNPTGLVTGWNRFSIPKTAFTNGATVQWGTIATVVLSVTATAGGTVNVTWDMLRLMLGPTIGYTNGRWDESGAVADIVDHVLRFASGVWVLNDLRIRPTDRYRTTGDTGITVALANGSATIGGTNKEVALFEIFNLSWVPWRRLQLEQPGFYADSAIMTGIRTAQGKQTGTLMSGILDVFRQSLVRLATYLLPVHESTLDIGSQFGTSLKKRRDRIVQIKTAAFLPMNLAGMKKLAEFFVNSVTVAHTPATYSFTVQVNDPKGIPSNSAELTAAIERAKPAHLNFTVVYTFTTWNVMDAYNRTWNVAETYTWDAFETS